MYTLPFCTAAAIYPASAAAARIKLCLHWGLHIFLRARLNNDLPIINRTPLIGENKLKKSQFRLSSIGQITTSFVLNSFASVTAEATALMRFSSPASASRTIILVSPLLARRYPTCKECTKKLYITSCLISSASIT